MTNRDYFENEGSTPSRRRIPGADKVFRGDQPAPEPEIIERIVEVEKQVEVYVPAPPYRDEHGVMWVGNIGFDATGLEFNGDVPIEEWAQFYEVGQSIDDSRKWQRGDFFARGADRYNLTYEQMAQHFGVAQKTVETYASIARSIPKFNRINSLPFSTHIVVMKMNHDKQAHWLNLAADNGWSKRQLANEIRRAQGKKPIIERSKKQGTTKAIKPIKSSLEKALKKVDESKYDEMADYLEMMAAELRRRKG